jgi:hypothetical protein
MVSKKITKAQANVRISKDKPNQVVKFKMLGAGTVRATARGERPIFVKQTENGAEARIRGENPLTAQTPDKAFARAVHTFWA